MGSITVAFYQCQGCGKSIRAGDYCRCPVGQQKEIADAHADLAEQRTREAEEKAERARETREWLAEREAWAASPEGIAEAARDEQERQEAAAERERAELQRREEREKADKAEHARFVADLRKIAANDNKDANLDTRERAVREREIARRERRADQHDSDATNAATAPVGDTLADYAREVTLLDVERLPSAFVRADGETLLYEGLANTIYGEPSTGKSWIALMAVIQQLRAGRWVIWWDAEDRATTLAKRLQLLRATDLIGHPNLKWITGEIHESPTAMIEALEFLDGGNGPGLVVIDSATSFGCPKDGADIQPWVRAHIRPWLDAGHTTLLLDHVPKQRKDRPAGAVGSYEKLSDIRGAALYAHGTAWNGQQGGAVHLTIHKDAHGQLPAPKFSAVATITADWDGPTLAYTVGLPNAKQEGEDLQMELLDVLEQAGTEGVKGSRAIRDLLKGKRAKDIDAAREELLTAGMIERVKEGNAWRYIVAT